MFFSSLLASDRGAEAGLWGESGSKIRSCNDAFLGFTLAPRIFLKIQAPTGEARQWSRHFLPGQFGRSLEFPGDCGCNLVGRSGALSYQSKFPSDHELGGSTCEQLPYGT